jgi:RNA polymerase sigma-70 factor (ECF subfamily)
MLRITEISRSQTVVRFRLEGRLTEQTIEGLRAAAGPDLATGRTLLLDLSELPFADAAGVRCLHELRNRGAVLMGCTTFVGELLRIEYPGARQTDIAGQENPDASLVGRLRAGDEAAFAELVTANTGRLLATAQRMLRSEDEARDAVQDAFMSAFKAIASFNGESKLSTWLHRITVNAALMRLRRRRQRPERSIDELLPRFREDGHFAEEPGNWAVSSQELLERRETRVMMRACIDRLPERYRTVLMMRDIEDLDMDEMSELLGITPNAVKIRVHRARQALRTLVAEALGESAPADRSVRAAAR